MSRPISIGASTVAIGVAAALGAAAVGYFGLRVVTRPPSASSRVATIAREADEAEQISSQLKSRQTYPRGAVCDGGGEAGLSIIRQEVANLASRSGGISADVSGAPAAPDESNGGLQRVDLTIDGGGAPSALIGFLQSLSTTTPSVFIDKLDLRSSDGKVTLRLTGRIFCSPLHL